MLQFTKQPSTGRETRKWKALNSQETKCHEHPSGKAALFTLGQKAGKTKRTRFEYYS
jgi:hypothetical protein